MNSSRLVRVLALVLVAVLALSGCTAATPTMKKNLVEIELAKLSGALYALPYVSVVSTFYDEEAEYEPQVRVVVSASAPSPEQATVVAVTANAALSQDLLSTMSRSFQLKDAGTPIFRQSDFSLTLDQLSTEIRYCFALQEAFGAPLAIGIDAAWEGEDQGAYQRWIDGSGSTPQPGDWDSLRSVDIPNPSAAQSWYFDGISVTGSLPPTEITDLAHLLMATLPQNNGNATIGSSWLLWDSTQQRLELVVDSFEQPSISQTEPFTALEVWPQAIEAATLLTDSGIPNASLTVGLTVDNEYQTSTVHMGSCARVSQVLDQDTALADALAAAGLTLPRGAGPGYCSEF